MFFEISKLLNIFLSPISWIILLLIGTFCIKNKNWRKACLISCIGVFGVCTNPLLVKYIKHQTVKQYSIDTPNTHKKHQVAIVMGGFGAMNRQTGQMRYEQDRADRLWEAVRLWKTGKIERILITGDPTSIIAPDSRSTASLFLSYMEEMGVPKEIFVLEQQARNTRENALNTEKTLKELNIKDSECILITSATHMERSMKCFAKIGIKPDYLAVNKYDKPRNINHRSFYPEWKAAVEWQELLNEWIGVGIYRVMGYV